MSKLCSVDDAKARLRYDGSGSDFIIEASIKGASAAILNYVSPADPDWLDSYGEPAAEDSDGVATGIPEDVVTACVVFTGILLRDPDAKESDSWEHGFLPRQVLCLLTPYRLPTLA